MEGNSDSSELSGSFSDLLMELDGEISPEIPINEELIEEVMRELYKEITTGSTPPPATFPPSPPSTQSLCVADGKNGSCGASVSDLASTVMAGIAFVGAGGKLGLLEANLGEKMDGCDGGDELDEEWLAMVLSWGPEMELEECWT